MPGLYSHTTRGTGTVLTATIYNSDHENHITNATPQQHDDYSSSAAQMRTATDPGEAGSESLATSLAGELERLRFAVKEIKNYLGIEPGSPEWYSTPTAKVDSNKLDTVQIADGGTGATTAAGARTNLGATATGDTLFTSASAAAARTALGATATGDSLFTAASAAAARTTVFDPIFDAKGDLVVASAADTAVRKAAASNGAVLLTESTQSDGLLWAVAALSGHISGLMQSRNGTDPSRDTDISAGVCMDATGAHFMRLASVLTKQLDAAWAVGTNQGGLDTGVIAANTWYYIWLIKRSDTGVVDALFSTSNSAPTMPTNYDFKRLIGAVRTDGTSNVFDYDAYEMSGGGLRFMWATPTADVTTAGLGTTPVTATIRVPALVVLSHLTIDVGDNTNANVTVYVYSPDAADTATSDLGQASSEVISSINANYADVMTNASGQIRYRAGAGSSQELDIFTLGFTMSRR